MGIVADKKSPLFSNGYNFPPHLAAASLQPFMPLAHPAMMAAMHNLIPPPALPLRPSSPRQEHNNNRVKDDDDEDSNHANEGGLVDLSIKSRDRSPISAGEEISDDEREASPSPQPQETKKNASGLIGIGGVCGSAGSGGAGSGSGGAFSQTRGRLGVVPHPGLLPDHDIPTNPVETILMNIHGMLKVAAETTRHNERQNNFEKGS